MPTRPYPDRFPDAASLLRGKGTAMPDKGLSDKGLPGRGLSGTGLAGAKLAEAEDAVFWLSTPAAACIRQHHYVRAGFVILAGLCGRWIGRLAGRLIGSLIGRFHRWGRRAADRPFALAGGLIAAGLLLGIFRESGLWDAAPTSAPRVAEPAAPPAPPPAWKTVARAPSLYALQAPELDRLPRASLVRRHENGTREDRLLAGSFAGDELHLNLAIRRLATDGDIDGEGLAASHFVATARRTAQAGLSVLRLAQPTPLPTKFGIGEAADALLAEGGQERACLVVGLSASEGLLRVDGWFCGSAQRPADRGALACLIDRLDLVAAGDDRPLKALFAAAERRREARCAAGAPNPSGRRLSWIDPVTAPPPLRGATARP